MTLEWHQNSPARIPCKNKMKKVGVWLNHSLGSSVSVSYLDYVDLSSPPGFHPGTVWNQFQGPFVSCQLLQTNTSLQLYLRLQWNSFQVNHLHVVLKMQSNMVMRVTPLWTEEELAPKYQNHQSAKSPFPCPSYTNQDICTQLPRESWKLTDMVSLPNLELEEASKRKFLYFQPAVESF
jgi:hypothetical protein